MRALHIQIKNSVYSIRIPSSFIFFWDSDNLALNEKHSCCLKSFLLTQPDHYTAKVWVNKIPANSFDSRIKFVRYETVELAKGSPLEKSFLLKMKDSKHWLDSDIFRYLILYKYGGIYTDFDFLFRRDLSPLMHKNFLYTWPDHSSVRRQQKWE